MAANAEVKGSVEYRAGDGPLIEVPRGPVEVALEIDCAVLSWGDEGKTQVTAIPMMDYERFIKEGKIVLY